MIYVGIDIAKNKHDIHIFDSETGEVMCSHLQIDNSTQGFKLLIKSIDSFPIDSVQIGMEATGHYHLNLANHLYAAGYAVGIINPLQTAALRRVNIRKTKTDKIDTVVIVHAMIAGYATPFQPNDEVYTQLRIFSRFRFENIQELTALKNRLIGVLDIVFPEYSQFFSTLHSKTSYTLLSQYPSAHIISRTRVDSLQKVLDTYQKRFNAADLKALAKSSIGTHNDAYSAQIKMLIEQIQLLLEQNKTVEIQLEVLLSTLNTTITPTPAVSTVLGAMILGEIQDVSSYSHPDKLFAFAGLDAVVYQSGQFEATQVHMSKRGSPYLRYALMKAAAVAVQFDTTFNSYYTDKIQHGKHYFVAINHCARKFVRILYKILTENIPYILQS